MAESRSVRVVLSVNAATFISGFRQAGSEVRTLQTAMRGLNVPDAVLRDIRLIGSTLSGQINNVHALRTALLGIGLPAGGLAGSAAMQRQIGDLEAQIRRLRSTAGAPIPLGPTPSHPLPTGGSSSASRSAGSGISAGDIARVAAYAGGFLALGSAVKSTYTQTADYETELNVFGAVTKASAGQLKQASTLALQLGADTSIAGANAADAAAALTELAKGGLSVQSSFEAAKGTLQLASAATVSVGTAAGIQTAALNSFALGADQAGKVADILSNTAAAASGEITDFAAGMKYSAVTSHQLGLSLTDNQTALALLAQAGMKGSMAGTAFNDVLIRALPTTKKTKDAMAQLGVTAFNSAGQFEGMPKLIDQLAAAHKRLSPAAFESANKIAFGIQGARASGVFADVAAKAIDHNTDAWKNMSSQITNGAGVVAFSTAKMSGLGGAFLNVKNQIETAQVTLGEKFSPALQTAMGAVSAAIPVMTGFLTGSSLGGGLKSIGDWFKPLISGAGDLISKAWPYIKSFVSSMGDAFSAAVGYIKPVADGIGHFFTNISQSGTVAMFGKALDAVGSAFASVLKFIEPVGKVVGDLISWFGQLPAPIYAGAAALGAFLLLRGPLSAMLLQAVFGVNRLYTSLAGLASGGIMNGIRTLGRGLLGAFGGPLGLAITAATIGITYLFSAMDSGSSSSKQMKQDTDDLTASLDQNTGALTDNTKATIVKQLSDDGTLKAVNAAGISVSDYTDAILGNADAQARVAQETKTAFIATITASDGYKSISKDLDAAGVSAVDLANAIQSGDPRVVVQKFATYGAQLKANGGDVSGFAGEQGTLNQILGDGVGTLETYSNLQGIAGTKTKELGDATAAAKLKIEALNGAAATAGEAHKEAAGGMSRAWDAAGKAVAASAAATAASTGASAQAIYNNWVNHIAGIAGFTVDSKGVATFETQWTLAFAKFKTDTNDAGDAADLFWFKMAGPAATAQQAIYATAAAMRAVGAAARDQGANNDAVTTAKAGVTTAQAKPTGGTDGYTNAQKILDVAAARRTLAAAMDTQAASQANLFAAEVDAGKAAATSVENTFKSTTATKGYSAGIKAATIEMGKQRKAFIDSRVAGEQSTMSDQEKAASLKGLQAEAGKAADSLGLIPGKTETIIDADPSALIAKATEAKKKADDLAKHKAVMQFGADISQGLTLYKQWFGVVAAMPKSVRTKFDADVAEAQTHGQFLYQVYDSTSKTWKATFETPGAAASQTAAGDLVQQYNLANGTWSATFIANTDQAVLAFQALTAAAETAVAAASAKATVSGTVQGHTLIAQAQAAGGPTMSNGPKGVDNQLAWVAPGEHMLTDKEVDRMGGHAAVYRFRRSLMSGAAGYASGGAIGSVAGSALGLSGRALASPGTIDSLVIQALQDIATAVTGARAAATGKQQAAADAATHLKDAQGGLSDAKQKQSDNIKAKASKAQLQQDATAVHAAQQTVDAATAAHDAAVKLAKAYGATATAAEKSQRAQQGLYRAQQGYAAHMDSLAGQLTTAQANLATLQGNKASAASGIASTVSGFDGGITGHSDTRGTYASILQGQKYDLAQAKKFQANLATLKKNGLNSATLNQIANAGIDGGGVTAAALAKASPAQLKALNATTGAITGVAGSIGQSVSGAMYDAGIQAATGLVNGLKSQMGAIQQVMNGIATSVISTLTKKLQIHSPSKVMDGHGRNTVLGYINGLNAMGPQVSDAMAGMLTIPTQPQRQLVSVSAGPQLDSRIAAGVQKAMDGWSFSIVQDPRGAWKVVQQGQKTSSRFGGRS